MGRRLANPIREVHGAFADMRSDYAAMKPSRFRRTRQGLQDGGGDQHIWNATQFNRMREYARDMDRNDSIVGSLVDRAVENIVQCGFRMEPQTGDEGLNKELFALWGEWADDPRECSATGQETFFDFEEQAIRSTFIDGDIFFLPLEDGPLQLIEAHRAQTPSRVRRDNVVHGVELGEKRERKRYWFTSDDVDKPLSQLVLDDMDMVDAYDADGEPLVYHVHFNRRATLTRGVTAFAPVFDKLGMIEDVDFAKLVQQQMVSAFAVFLERDVNFKFDRLPDLRTGSRETERLPDGNTHTIEGITPGMFVRGHPGEKLQAVSANVPNAEYFPHVRHLVRQVGLALGLPLVIALMDGSETNFSGWRGAVDTARMGFRAKQKRLAAKFHKPAWRWKVRQWLALKRIQGSKVQSLAAGGELFRVKVETPGWPYIEPLTDAKADTVRLVNGMASPRQIASERGRDWDTIVDERVEDMAQLIEKSAQKAQELSAKLGVEVHWREVAHLATPDGLRGMLDLGNGTDPQGRDAEKGDR